MAKLHVFGDVHFSALNEWNYQAGAKFISWFKTVFIPSVSCDDTILFLGDITEKDCNPGDVIDQVAELFMAASNVFKMTYIIMGNHDLKLYKESPQYSIKFINRFNNVKVIKDITDLDINGLKVRCCPHMRIPGMSINDYYSKYNWDDYEEADITVGHWNKFNPKNKMARGVDISNMKSKIFCLGHIHTREDEDYVGSIYPNKDSEMGERVYKSFEKIGNDINVIETKLPTFLDYLKVDYPNKIEDTTDDTIHVYEVNNCRSLTEAQRYYAPKFVNKVNIPKLKKRDEKNVASSASFKLSSNKEAFKQFLEETKYIISDKAKALIESVL